MANRMRQSIFTAVVIACIAVLILLSYYDFSVQFHDAEHSDAVSALRAIAERETALLKKKAADHEAQVRLFAGVLGASDAGDAAQWSDESGFWRVWHISADGACEAPLPDALFPSVAAALSGETGCVSFHDGEALHLASYAPVLRDGKIDGALIGAWDISAEGEPETYFSVLFFDDSGYSAPVSVFSREALASLCENPNSGKNDASLLPGKSSFYCAPASIADLFVLCYVADAYYSAEDAKYLRIALIFALKCLLLTAFLALVLVYSQRTARKSVEKLYRETAYLFDNLPGGIYKCALGDDAKILSASAGLYSITGYSKEQFDSSFGASFTRVVHPLDLERFLRCNPYDAPEGVHRMRFRVLRRDGSVRWVSSQFQTRVENGEKIAYGYLTDITEQVHSELELDISQQKYKIAMALTPHIVFEFDPSNRFIDTDPTQKCGLELPRHIENVPDGLIDSGIIHPDDAQTVRDMFYSICCGAHDAFCEVRLRTTCGSYEWYRLDMTNIFGEDASPARTVAILRNIEREKESEIDQLTEAYNRVSIERKIDALLQKMSHGETHAFVLFDLDHFKRINDSFGHLSGDDALQKVSCLLRESLRSSDIVGRLGGDEFCALLQNARSEAHALNKVENILAQVSDIEVEGMHGARITASAGVCFAKADGASFKTLYAHADEALYIAKNGGRNRCVQYKRKKEALS